MQILDDCVCCGSCAHYCPVDAIYEGKDRYYVEQDKCINCHACEDACPVNSISFD